LLFLHAYIQPESSVSTHAVYIPESAHSSKLGGALAKILIASPRVLNFSVEQKKTRAGGENFLQREPHILLAVLVSGRCMRISSAAL